MEAVSKATIYSIINRWHSGGFDGLANKPKSGRHSMVDDEYSLALKEVIEEEPSELGYDFTIRAIDRLRTHLEKKPGISLIESHFWALLKRKGYRYHRPNYYMGHLHDKEAKAGVAEVLEELRKRSSKAISS